MVVFCCFLAVDGIFIVLSWFSKLAFYSLFVVFKKIYFENHEKTIRKTARKPPKIIPTNNFFPEEYKLSINLVVLDDINSDEEVLNGDDVPLVEDIMEQLVQSEKKKSSRSKHNSAQTLNGEDMGLNGDNFMSTVLNSNSEMMKEAAAQANDEEEPKKKKKKKKVNLDKSCDNVTKKKKQKSSNLSENELGSEEVGRKYLEWILSPVEVNQFKNDSWEKRPVHIQRNQKGYYKSLFSTKAFDSILREQNVIYGKNLDVTSYDGKRETHNPVGRAYPPVVWDFYNNGCSLRMLNPQTFWEPVWKACATLQEVFGKLYS